MRRPGLSAEEEEGAPSRGAAAPFYARPRVGARWVASQRRRRPVRGSFVGSGSIHPLILPILAFV